MGEKNELARDKNNVQAQHLNSKLIELQLDQPEREAKIKRLKKEQPELKRDVHEEEVDFQKQKRELLKQLNEQKKPGSDVELPEAPRSSDELRKGLTAVRKEIDDITKKMGRHGELEKLRRKIEEVKMGEAQARLCIKAMDKMIHKKQEEALQERSKSEIKRQEVEAVKDKNRLQRRLHEEQKPLLQERIYMEEADIDQLNRDIREKERDFKARTDEANRMDVEIEEMKRILKLDAEQANYIRKNSIRESKKLADERRKKFAEAQRKKQAEAAQKVIPEPVLSKEPDFKSKGGRSRSGSSSSSASSRSSVSLNTDTDIASQANAEELGVDYQGWDHIKGGTIEPYKFSTAQRD